MKKNQEITFKLRTDAFYKVYYFLSSSIYVVGNDETDDTRITPTQKVISYFFHISFILIVCKNNNNITSNAVKITPITKGNPNKSCRAIALPKSSAKSQAIIAISQRIQRIKVTRRGK